MMTIQLRVVTRIRDIDGVPIDTAIALEMDALEACIDVIKARLPEANVDGKAWLDHQFPKEEHGAD